MITVGIFIKDDLGNYNRIELFADENISVNSSIQNVNDISKTFTDFSQTFTIPASKQNNKIFKHWYENSNDNGFSTLIKADAYIELDTIPFRTGKIQLESCNIKNGKPQDYSITFIGILGNLKDTFNGLLLKDLDTGEFDFSYSGSIVRTMVTTQTSNNIKYPLISSLRQWYYSGVAGADNISTLVGTINHTELFPAIRLRKVLQLIQNKFGITFQGTFIDSDSKFLNAFLLLKNAEIFKIIYKTLPIDYQTKSGAANYIDFNLATDEMTFTANPTIQKRTVTINITNSIPNIPFTLYCYKDNVILTSVKLISIVGAQNRLLFQKDGGDEDLSKYSFRISYEGISSFTSNAILETTQSGVGATSMTLTQSLSQMPSSTINVASYMPELKIEDFFGGILKMFNLTCYSTVDGVYNLEQIESYYTSGTIRNITKYIKSDNINLNRSKTYSKINFQYEKSENLLSTAFLSNNRVEYGNLLLDIDSEGSTYDIKLPFENPLFSNLTTNLSAGFLIKSDLKAYIPKAIILYDYGVLQTVPQYYFNSQAATTYNAFGGETSISGVTYSLNFGQEQSPMTNLLVPNSLYSQYYQSYLTNIFDFKARLIKVSAILPISLLTSLKLNDRLIIRDKRYLINTMQTNLITGEVQFELLTDNRIL